MKSPPLRSFRAENFKAICDSGRMHFGWLTVFIGNNGSGKSSLVEAMEMLRDNVRDGLDSALCRWHDFEHVRNKSREHNLIKRVDHRPGDSHPIRFRFNWTWQGRVLDCLQEITQGEGRNSLFFQQEQIIQRRVGRTERWTRDAYGRVFFQGKRSDPERREESDSAEANRLQDGQSMLRRFTTETLDRWQFLLLNPGQMGDPIRQQRAGGEVRLAKDGSNIAQYLNDLLARDPSAFNGILDAIRFVLPYAVNLQPVLKSELERSIYIEMKEGAFDVPGWLLSTGTLRVLALLAVLRHPDPPPLLVIEEIENGLDPRTIHLIVEEIRATVEAGKTQIILTTHSPYLLDLLPLSSIVLVDRVDGEPRFYRPADNDEVQQWAKSFAPGQLYTMGRLHEEGKR